MLSHLRECLLKAVSRLSWLDVAWQHVVISWLRVIFLKLTWFHAFLNSSSYDQYESCRNFANIISGSDDRNLPRDCSLRAPYWIEQNRKRNQAQVNWNKREIQVSYMKCIDKKNTEKRRPKTENYTEKRKAGIKNYRVVYFPFKFWIGKSRGPCFWDHVWVALKWNEGSL